MSSADNTSSVPTVLVTGAGKRLGRAIALGLAAAGWRVAVHYRESAAQAQQTADECAALCAGAQCFATDLSDEKQTKALVHTVADRMGHVDAVVNSAALFEHDSADNFSYALLQKHMLTNTAAAIMLAQKLHAHACERDGSGVVAEGDDDAMQLHGSLVFVAVGK